MVKCFTSDKKVYAPDGESDDESKRNTALSGVMMR